MESRNRIEKTGDGFPTFISGKYNAKYHSGHGAMSESLHVFVNAGFQYFTEKYPDRQQIEIIEYGFGTGLNAWLTSLECKNGPKIKYTALELFPLNTSELSTYREAIPKDFASDDERRYFSLIHETAWGDFSEVHPHFQLKKVRTDFRTFQPKIGPDLIYYDAFGPGTQPELWTKEIFTPLFECLPAGGIIATYCVQGHFRRMLSELGFQWEKLPGPPGKREMLRITKPRQSGE
jgi:tRNA U34 5-methylaminomethyl-2-thiouridine-forming methyltransferase MnmC